MLLQTQSHSLRPLTTAHLAQTMTLLGLTAVELRQKVETALASNPALELMEEHRCPTCHHLLLNNGPCPLCSRPEKPTCDETIIFLSSREDLFTRKNAPVTGELPDDNIGAETEDLPHYILHQVAAELEPEDRLLAAHILTNLDEDGLLAVPLLEIARYHHIPLSRLEPVMRLIQHAEPLGVGSTSPQEAMLVQLEVLSETQPIPALTAQAIRQGMNLLSRHCYSELGQRLSIPVRQVKEIARFISDNLNPYPARAYWGDIRQGTGPAPEVYRFPDVIITQLTGDEDSPLVVEVIAPFAGTLRLNPLFREALRQAPPDKSEQWRSDLEQAILLVKCLQQRNQAIVRLMQRLVSLQRGFILHGEAYLKPITRARLAQELDVHESTISRAVSGKAAQLPSGRIVPLSKFFDRSLQVRTALKQIIEQEGPSLSDSDIANLLSRQGFPVARRTVAKYRAMEGILPAHLRQHLH